MKKRKKNPMYYFVEVSGRVVSKHSDLAVARMKAKEWKKYYGGRAPVHITQQYQKNPVSKHKYSPQARYKHKRVRSPKKFDPRSFRVTDPGRPGHTKLVIGCPKGQYDPKRKRCKVGTRVQKVLREKNPIYLTTKGNRVEIFKRLGMWYAHVYHAGVRLYNISGKTERDAKRGLKEVGVTLGKRIG